MARRRKHVGGRPGWAGGAAAAPPAPRPPVPVPVLAIGRPQGAAPTKRPTGATARRLPVRFSTAKIPWLTSKN